MPDAAAVRSGASHFHRAGITGRGVRVALVDSGVAPAPWFSDRGYRLVSDERPPIGSHGLRMAAVLFAIAPDVTLHAVTLGDEPAEALARGLAVADFAVAAWGIPTGPASFDLSRVVSVYDLTRVEWPGHAAGAHVVTRDTPWPTGPFAFELARGFAGLSAAAAIIAGMAALQMQEGASVEDALRRTLTTPPLSLSPRPGCRPC